jgi:sigma-E factor negative regulatory protein RseC
MLETRAIVIRVEGREALVESMQGGGCGHCDSEKGCGSGKLSQLFCSEPRRFRVRNDANAQVGTVVQIALAEGLLLRSALLMYMLPLLLLLCGAMTGAQFAGGEQSREVYSAIGGLLGLSLGFAIVKVISLRRNFSAVAQPIILPPAEMNLRSAD